MPQNVQAPAHLDKHLAQIRDDRAPELGVAVHDTMAILSILGQVTVADVHAAGERHGPIHHQDFAVIS